MLDRVKERLRSFGYAPTDEDEAALAFCVRKAEWTIKNDCNVDAVPAGLECVAVDMAVGEFLAAKKTFSPGGLEGLDLDAAVSQIQEGDTTVAFAAGGGSLTPEQRLDALIERLLTCGREQFSCYRRLRW